MNEYVAPNFVQEVWIGRRYLGELRECNLVTRAPEYSEIPFLATEAEALAGANSIGIPVYIRDDYYGALQPAREADVCVQPE